MPAERSDLWDCRVRFFTPLRSVQNDMPAERSDLSTGTAVLDSSLRCALFRMTCRLRCAKRGGTSSRQQLLHTRFDLLGNRAVGLPFVA